MVHALRSSHVYAPTHSTSQFENYNTNLKLSVTPRVMPTTPICAKQLKPHAASIPSCKAKCSRTTSYTSQVPIPTDSPSSPPVSTTSRTLATSYRLARNGPMKQTSREVHGMYLSSNPPLHLHLLSLIHSLLSPSNRYSHSLNPIVHFFLPFFHILAELSEPFKSINYHDAFLWRFPVAGPCGWYSRGPNACSSP